MTQWIFGPAGGEGEMGMEDVCCVFVLLGGGGRGGMGGG